MNPDDEVPGLDDADEIRAERARVTPRAPSSPIALGAVQSPALGGALGDPDEMPKLAWVKCPARCGREMLAGRKGVCAYCEEKSMRDRKRLGPQSALEQSITGDFVSARFELDCIAARVKRPQFLAAAPRLVAAPRILFRGGAGLGKTTLAVCMLRRWAERNEGDALFVPATHLSGGKFNIEDHLLRLHLVLLDDLGAELDMKSNLIPRFIYERHLAGRATWITTGLDKQQVIDRYGEGIARRVHGSNEDVVLFDFNTGSIT